jgi:outer membrane murein-binding lipoprotein Lpp
MTKLERLRQEVEAASKHLKKAQDEEFFANIRRRYAETSLRDAEKDLAAWTEELNATVARMKETSV